MAEQWYYARGKDKFGPFTAAQLKALAAQGRILPTDMLHKEGMPKWVAASSVKGLFAPTKATAPPTPLPVAPPTLPPSVVIPMSEAMDDTRPTIVPPNPPPLVSAEVLPSRSVDEYNGGNAKKSKKRLIIGLSLGGGAVLIGLVVLIIILNRGGGEAGVDKGDAKTAEGSDWGNPIRVSEEVGEGKGSTTFLVGLKDAWWTDYSSRGAKEEKKTFIVVYYFKNLGPREGYFLLDKVEIKTDKGHFFSNIGFFRNEDRLNRLDGVGWWPDQSENKIKIEQTIESPLVFEIPKDEIPTELVFSGRVQLDGKLPQRVFGFRRYDKSFGFMPESAEEAVPSLIDLLKAEKFEPGQGKLVPNTEIRLAAANALGEIGPLAKEAIPALKNVMDQESGNRFRGSLYDVARKALAKIGEKPSKDDLEKDIQTFKAFVAAVEKVLADTKDEAKKKELEQTLIGVKKALKKAEDALNKLK